MSFNALENFHTILSFWEDNSPFLQIPKGNHPCLEGRFYLVNELFEIAAQSPINNPPLKILKKISNQNPDDPLLQAKIQKLQCIFTALEKYDSIEGIYQSLGLDKWIKQQENTSVARSNADAILYNYLSNENTLTLSGEVKSYPPCLKKFRWIQNICIKNCSNNIQDLIDSIPIIVRTLTLSSSISSQESLSLFKVPAKKLFLKNFPDLIEIETIEGPKEIHIQNCSELIYIFDLSDTKKLTIDTVHNNCNLPVDTPLKELHCKNVYGLSIPEYLLNKLSLDSTALEEPISHITANALQHFNINRSIPFGLRQMNFPNLITFKISNSSLAILPKMENLKVLTCKNMETLECGFHFLPHLKKAYFSNCKKVQTLPPMRNRLKELIIDHCPTESIPGNFPNLRMAIFSNCPYLEWPSGSTPRLLSLEILGSPKCIPPKHVIAACKEYKGPFTLCINSENPRKRSGSEFLEGEPPYKSTNQKYPSRAILQKEFP